VNLLLNSNLTKVNGDSILKEVVVQNKADEDSRAIATDELILLFGLSPKLGPIESWGLNLDKNAIEVNMEDYSTNISGVYAIGDINIYKNKLKLILCGFHEAAIVSHSIYKYINPGVKYTLKYTTVNGVKAF
jgi:thioredoxin reductase (NADPH)